MKYPTYNEKTYRLIIELLIITIIVLIAYVSSLIMQPSIQFNSGLGWDGEKYRQMAFQMLQGMPVESKAPFVYRIGTPWLVVKFFHGDIKSGFIYINSFCSILLPFIIYFYLRRKPINSGLATLAALVYCGFWHSPINFFSFYPYYTDPAGLLFLFLGIYFSSLNIARNKKIILLTFSAGLGVFFREFAAIPALVFFLNDFFIERNQSLRFDYKFLFVKVKEVLSVSTLQSLIPITISALVYLSITLSVHQTNTHRFWNAAYDLLYNKPVLNYIHSLLIAYGSIFFIIFFNYKRIVPLMMEFKQEAMYAVIFLVLAFVGGADTERIAFFGAPVIFFFIAKMVELDEVKSLAYLSVIVITTMLAMRIFLPIPLNLSTYHEIPIITLFSDSTNYLDLYASHGDNKIKLISFAEHIIIFIILLILRRKHK